MVNPLVPPKMPALTERDWRSILKGPATIDWFAGYDSPRGRCQVSKNARLLKIPRSEWSRKQTAAFDEIPQFYLP